MSILLMGGWMDGGGILYNVAGGFSEQLYFERKMRYAAPGNEYTKPVRI